MVHLFQVGFQRRHILVFHALADKEGIGALPELIHQNILALHGINVIRQVVEDIVIDPGVEKAYGGWDQQQDTEDEDRYAQFYDFFTEFQHNGSFLPF